MNIAKISPVAFNGATLTLDARFNDDKECYRQFIDVDHIKQVAEVMGEILIIEEKPWEDRQNIFHVDTYGENRKTQVLAAINTAKNGIDVSI